MAPESDRPLHRPTLIPPTAREGHPAHFPNGPERGPGIVAGRALDEANALRAAAGLSTLRAADVAELLRRAGADRLWWVPSGTPTERRSEIERAGFRLVPQEQATRRHDPRDIALGQQIRRAMSTALMYGSLRIVVLAHTPCIHGVLIDAATREHRVVLLGESALLPAELEQLIGYRGMVEFVDLPAEVI